MITALSFLLDFTVTLGRMCPLKIMGGKNIQRLNLLVEH
jgi:hypothetical protein